jgi:hypothetical protein
MRPGRRFVDVRNGTKATNIRFRTTCRDMQCVDGSGLTREMFTSQAWSVQPRVRPADAVHITAGHITLRESGPGQNLAFDNAPAQVGCPDRGSTGSALRVASPPDFTSYRMSGAISLTDHQFASTRHPRQPNLQGGPREGV